LPSGVLLCGKDGKWKTKLEELPQPNQVVVLLSIGDVKYDVINYLHAHPNTQIPEMPKNNQRIGFNEHTSYKSTPFF